MDKKARKKEAKKCRFCDETDYNLLDVHRICPGESGGKYNYINTIVCCANCHRKIHSGQIKTIRKYLSTSGRYILHYTIDDKEYFD